MIKGFRMGEKVFVKSPYTGKELSGDISNYDSGMASMYNVGYLVYVDVWKRSEWFAIDNIRKDKQI